MKNQKQKLCKICGKEMPIKNYGKWCYCDDCKKTDEYKQLEKNGNFTIKNKGKLIFKTCMFCHKKVELYVFSHPICNECKKTAEYKDYIDKQRNHIIKRPCKFCGKILDTKKYNNTPVCNDCKIVHKGERSYLKKQIKKQCKICHKDYFRKKVEIERICDECKQNIIVKRKCRVCGNMFKRKRGDITIDCCEACRNKFTEIDRAKIRKCKKCGKIVQIARFVPNLCEDCQKTNYFFTKPHRALKAIIDDNFPNNAFKTERIITCDHQAFSLDEYDKYRKIVIYVDGCFWHANPKTYKSTDKVIANKTAADIWRRDKYVKTTLEKNGYIVLRFWEDTIYNNPQSCILFIKAALDNCKILQRIRKIQSMIKGETIEHIDLCNSFKNNSDDKNTLFKFMNKYA